MSRIPYANIAEWGAWVVDTQHPERFGIVECSSVRKVWVVFDPNVWPPEKRRRDQLRQMTDDEINAWAASRPAPSPSQEVRA